MPAVAANGLQAVYEMIAAHMARNPFAEQLPFMLGEARLMHKENTWLLCDHMGKGAIISNAADECWQVLAFSRGKTFNCFGIYEREEFQLHTLWTDNKICFLK